MSGWTGERTPMHQILSHWLDRIGHCGMPLKGTRDKVMVVMHPPTYAMATNSYLTIIGTRRDKWQVGTTDADPAPQEPVRNTLAAFVHAADEENPRFFLLPWTEYQLMLFWRIQHSAARRRLTIGLDDVGTWEDRWDLLGAPGRDGPGGRILRGRGTP